MNLQLINLPVETLFNILRFVEEPTVMGIICKYINLLFKDEYLCRELVTTMYNKIQPICKTWHDSHLLLSKFTHLQIASLDKLVSRGKYNMETLLWFYNKQYLKGENWIPINDIIVVIYYSHKSHFINVCVIDDTTDDLYCLIRQGSTLIYVSDTPTHCSKNNIQQILTNKTLSSRSHDNSITDYIHLTKSQLHKLSCIYSCDVF